MYVMGIDLGTGGARVVVCDGQGKVITTTNRELNSSDVKLPAGYHEQYSDDWWDALSIAIREALVNLNNHHINSEEITAISVTSTSGTILPMDADYVAIHPALMYNDSRSNREADQVNLAAVSFNQQHGRSFNASYALAKICWIKNNRPDIFKKTKRWVHATDYIVGKLTGDYGVSDYSNALKTGYDLFNLEWPEFIEKDLGIPVSSLPEVVAPGEVIGKISQKCADETGLSINSIVCAGMTDSSASLLATGAAKPGDWSSTIGTTLSLKGISEGLVRDPSGAVYCHRHPNSWWLPGAASNVGGEWLKVLFEDCDKQEMDKQAGLMGISNLVVYPLVRKGERFPFVNKDAEGFIVGQPVGEVDKYRGYLEGVGLVERLCFDLFERLGAKVGKDIYISGGSARSRVWTQIRADIMQRRLLKPELPESAMGAAILAAARTLFSDLVDAGRAMVRVEDVVEPDTRTYSQYEEKYGQFILNLKKRNYLPESY